MLSSSLHTSSQGQHFGHSHHSSFTAAPTHLDSNQTSTAEPVFGEARTCATMVSRSDPFFDSPLPEDVDKRFHSKQMSMTDPVSTKDYPPWPHLIPPSLVKRIKKAVSAEDPTAFTEPVEKMFLALRHDEWETIAKDSRLDYVSSLEWAQRAEKYPHLYGEAVAASKRYEQRYTCCLNVRVLGLLAGRLQETSAASLPTAAPSTLSPATASASPVKVGKLVEVD